MVQNCGYEDGIQKYLRKNNKTVEKYNNRNSVLYTAVCVYYIGIVK